MSFLRVVKFFAFICLLLAASAVSAQSSADWPLTDFETRSIELNEVMSGGPPRDGIPPIDAPKFIGFDEADTWLHEDEPVVSFELKGDARAYPIQILMFHEIVNDSVGGQPVSVTFCPLCNSSIVFDRMVNGCLLYTSPSPRDKRQSRMPSSA